MCAVCHAARTRGCLAGAVADIEVRDVPEEQRYEAWVEGQMAGFAGYQKTHDLIVFTHTDVEPEFKGKGIGSTLVRHALDDVRARGTLRVLPLCPFVKSWVANHREYADLLYQNRSKVSD